MGALLALVALHAALITVRGGDARCPSSRQVNEAVASRLPGVVVPASSTPSAGVLELRLIESPSEHRFALVDSRGEELLSRPLPATSPTAARDCEALAETVALIVDRYLQQLAYQEQEAPAASPVDNGPRAQRWELFAGGTWQPGPADMAGYQALLGFGRVLGQAGRLALEATAGLNGTVDHEWGGARGRLWRFPVEVRLLWRKPGKRVQAELGPFTGVHLLVLASNPRDMQKNDLWLAPVVGGLGALRLSLGPNLFARLVGAAAVDIVRYEFMPQSPDSHQSFGTPRGYVKMGLEGGIAFW
jgi:hypothetical protein